MHPALACLSACHANFSMQGASEKQPASPLSTRVSRLVALAGLIGLVLGLNHVTTTAPCPEATLPRGDGLKERQRLARMNNGSACLVCLVEHSASYALSPKELVSKQGKMPLAKGAMARGCVLLKKGGRPVEGHRRKKRCGALRPRDMSEVATATQGGVPHDLQCRAEGESLRGHCCGAA